MAKEVSQYVKIHLEGGKANPAGVGTVLGPTGINMGEFCQKFNEETKSRDEIIPVVISIYSDRSYSFITKVSPASRLILKAVGIEKGSPNSKETKVGQLTQKQLTELAEQKIPDLNANSIDQAKNIIAGTARSLGITIEGEVSNAKAQ